jgi:hypothetical protein
MPKRVKNMGASIRARLLALAKERNHPFDLLLTRYTLSFVGRDTHCVIGGARLAGSAVNFMEVSLFPKS